MSSEITLAFSSCPNDTFIFDALVHKRIDTEGLKFNYYINDVETLNKNANNTIYDVTKLSFNAFFNVLSHYICAASGAALCDDFGPALVSKKKYTTPEIEQLSVAVPGLNTTANFLFNTFYKAKELVPMIFSDIENAVLSDTIPLGVIIHENVFTYKTMGLVEIANLGTLWQNFYKLPVPLGCIAIKRSLPTNIILKINDLIKKSVMYALNNPQQSNDFVKQYALNLSSDVIKKHIAMYVNDYTLDLNDNAKSAVLKMMDLIKTQKLINYPNIPIFV